MPKSRIEYYEKTVNIKKKKRNPLLILSLSSAALLLVCFGTVVFMEYNRFSAERSLAVEIPEKVQSDGVDTVKEDELIPDTTEDSEPHVEQPDPEITPKVESRSDGCTYVIYGELEMLLVNKTNPIPKEYGDELGQGLNPSAQAAFDAMQAAAAQEGISFWVGSGRRDYETQESVYNGWVAIKGEAEANRVSAKPGTSEHQTGLAIDIDSGEYYLSKKFETTQAFAWLDEHAHEYGFILRYLKDKESETGYDYEPWHYRYVGVEYAQILKDSGKTVEAFAGLV